jgi:hypothetical protein
MKFLFSADSGVYLLSIDKDTNVDTFKFDVPLSFLAQDEGLATELTDLLQDRMSIFLYSKRQEDVAGTDGERSFNAVFGEEARLVVVLYRKGWGESPWTRIEETAIRNRGYKEGYDFVCFIPLDEPGSVPKWLPRNRLWIGLKRWGVTGAASVIEARAQELGGQPHEESVEDRAKRLERGIQFEDRRRKFLNSQDGVNAANVEFVMLIEELEKLIGSVRETSSSVSYELKKTKSQLVVISSHAGRILNGLSVNWRCLYSNTLHDSELEVSLWEGHPPFPGVSHWVAPYQRKSLSFAFDLLKSEKPGWVLSSSTNREFDSKFLATYILKHYMDDAQPKR